MAVRYMYTTNDDVAFLFRQIAIQKSRANALKQEVRAAVADYLETMIHERSRPEMGHNMAVSPRELLGSLGRNEQCGTGAGKG